MRREWPLGGLVVFICSWRKPKYPRQELCCCYYCLISPRWNFRESPRWRLESPSFQLRIHWIIWFLLPLHAVRQTSNSTKSWGSSSGSAPPHSFLINGGLAEWYQFDWPASLQVTGMGGWGGDDVATTSLWSGKICQSSGWSPPSSSLICNQPCVVSAANWATPLLWKGKVKKSAYHFSVQLDAASPAATVGNAGVYTKRLRRRRRAASVNQQALRLQGTREPVLPQRHISSRTIAFASVHAVAQS